MLNPYAIVTVKNYNNADEITEVPLDYEIGIEATDNKELPDYYFSDLDGNTIGKTVTGEFGFSDKEEKKYKINFVNTGYENVIRDIKVISKATQK